MHIEIISFSRERVLVEAENEYLQRLRREVPVQIVELGLKKAAAKRPAKQQQAEQAKALFSHIKEGSKLVVLDEGGRLLDSQQFAELLKEQMVRGVPEVYFAVGAPFGWPEEVKKRADISLSLSPMTFPAHVARLLVIEQLYRAICILKRHPYHK